MKGRKTIAVLAALLLAAVMIGTAAAEATVKPLAPETDIDHLNNRFVTTDIEYKGNGKAELTLYEYESFDGAAIKAVKAGDVIDSDGQETTVESVEWDGPDLYFNRGTENEMLLCEDRDGNFQHVYHEEDDRIPYVRIGSMEAEILPYITMLDWVDPKTGDPLDNVAVRDGEELLKLLESGDGPSFAVKNVRILYDNNNMPTLVWRFYSPAQ